MLSKETAVEHVGPLKAVVLAHQTIFLNFLVNKLLIPVALIPDAGMEYGMETSSSTYRWLSTMQLHCVATDPDFQFSIGRQFLETNWIYMFT